MSAVAGKASPTREKGEGKMENAPFMGRFFVVPSAFSLFP
jgi:hypothetical protein